MVKVYTADINGIAIEPEWLKLVSEPKRQRLYGIRHTRSMALTLCGDLLVRFLAMQSLGISNRDLLFQATATGKPCLLNSPQPFCFNLSHSGHWVTCAIDQDPVGIDVQFMEPVSLELAENVLPISSYRFYLHLSPQQQRDYFYDLWTRHESSRKLTGQGLSDPIAAPLDQFEKQPLCYRRYDFDPEYCLMVCALSNHFTPALFHIDVNDMVKKLSASD